ncbi:MAG: hypothetical protein IKV55_01690 [Oscillospiraceae bacterium]|nr:hypothetical protein [Oscillospiraceae bacterium]
MKRCFAAGRVTALLLVLLLCVTLCGCKKSVAENVELPEMNTDAAQRLLDYVYRDENLSLSFDSADIAQLIFFESYIEVLKSNNEKVTVVVYAPVFEEVFEAVYNTDPEDTEDVFDKYYEVVYTDAYLENGIPENIEFDTVQQQNEYMYRCSIMETKLTLTVDENGIPLESWEFTDAMYGGLLTYFDKVMSETQWEDAK